MDSLDQTPHSSILPPMPALGAHPAPLTSLSSCLTYGGTPEDALAGVGPISQLHQPVGVSLESPSPDLPLSFPLDLDRERVRKDDLSFVLFAASGGSINDTRLGVERPELPMPIASDTLSQLLLRERAGEVGVGGADLPLLPLRAECRGGLGGRVEDVCRALVNNRETLAVAVEVSATGATDGGLRNVGRASSRCFCLSAEGGWCSRMLRR